MAQVLTFPEPVSFLSVRSSSRKRLSDDDYWAFCEANPDLRMERTAEGEIAIMPPAGGESDYRNAEVVRQLANWAVQSENGRAFGPSVQFFLPDGSALSPDAAWVSNKALDRLTKQERRKFLRLTPEFVIEVMSPSDSMREAKAKMEQWISNGVRLAWLIDGDAEAVHLYQRGAAPRVRRHAKELVGSGPIEGFVLNLARIWRGL